jgi:hypothetical protein
MIDYRRDLIDADVRRGNTSAVRNRHAGPKDRASWAAILSAEMDAAIATHHRSTVPVQLLSLNNSVVGGHAPLPGRDSLPLGGAR